MKGKSADMGMDILQHRTFQRGEFTPGDQGEGQKAQHRAVTGQELRGSRPAGLAVRSRWKKEQKDPHESTLAPGATAQGYSSLRLVVFLQQQRMSQRELAGLYLQPAEHLTAS